MTTRTDEKRQPLLADRFLTFQPKAGSWDRAVMSRTRDQLRRAARAAHRFVFDEEATERVAMIVAKVPDLLVREHDFARPPYETCWIEFPAYTYMDSVEAMTGITGSMPAEECDGQLAFLIAQNRVNIIVGGTRKRPDGPVVVAPFQYQLHTDWDEADQRAFLDDVGGRQRVGDLPDWGAELDAFFWGSSYSLLPAEHRSLLRRRHAVELVPQMRDDPLLGDGALVDIFRGSAGELRTLIAMLLMLNRPSLTRFVTRTRGRGWLKNRVIPYLSHSSVVVDLDAINTVVRGEGSASGITLRRHAVRGHYCHDKTAHDYMRIAGCIHEWTACDEEWIPIAGETAADDVDHWICKACDGKRWWRKDHHRGDATKGFVIHDEYAVTN